MSNIRYWNYHYVRRRGRCNQNLGTDDTELLAILQRIGIANWLLVAVFSVSSSNYTAIILDSSMAVAPKFHTMQRTCFSCSQ
ncbi:hypothetical protein HAX54_023593 [Datura stramonium]|uniref:Uncharacterized protein n=1 Tax=Datura stramonium TaxID=4076 RepID=A0ABS8UXN5_DATST|nr:hypothetical protein [Datura stramonium]